MTHAPSSQALYIVSKETSCCQFKRTSGSVITLTWRIQCVTTWPCFPLTTNVDRALLQSGWLSPNLSTFSYNQNSFTTRRCD